MTRKPAKKKFIFHIKKYIKRLKYYVKKYINDVNIKLQEIIVPKKDKCSKQEFRLIKELKNISTNCEGCCQN